MKFDLRYDPEADAAYIDLSDAPVHDTEEIEDGVMLDYDKDGKIIGIEILDFMERLEEAKNRKHPASADLSVLDQVTPIPEKAKAS